MTSPEMVPQGESATRSEPAKPPAGLVDSRASASRRTVSQLASDIEALLSDPARHSDAAARACLADAKRLVLQSDENPLFGSSVPTPDDDGGERQIHTGIGVRRFSRNWRSSATRSA